MTLPSRFLYKCDTYKDHLSKPCARLVMKRVPCIPCGAIGKAGGAAADVDDVASDADNCRRELEIGQIAVPRFPRSETIRR